MVRGVQVMVMLMGLMILTGLGGMVEQATKTPPPAPAPAAATPAPAPPVIPDALKVQILQTERNVASSWVQIRNLQDQINQDQQQLNALAAQACPGKFTLDRDKIVCVAVPEPKAEEPKKP